MLAIIKTEKMEKEKISFLKHVAKIIDARISIISEDDYAEEIANKLIEEGLKTKILPKYIIRKKFRKHGLDI